MCVDPGYDPRIFQTTSQWDDNILKKSSELKDNMTSYQKNELLITVFLIQFFLHVKEVCHVAEGKVSCFVATVLHNTHQKQMQM